MTKGKNGSIIYYHGKTIKIILDNYDSEYIMSALTFVTTLAISIALTILVIVTEIVDNEDN